MNDKTLITFLVTTIVIFIVLEAEGLIGKESLVFACVMLFITGLITGLMNIFYKEE